MVIRIAGTVGESIVDGPGIRYTIFTQGCPHHCEGCHNPETHDFNGGKLADTDKIYAHIIADPLLKGVTFSGGEPLLNAKFINEIAPLLKSENIGYCLDTSGSVELTDEVKTAIDNADMVILDVKFYNAEDYKKYTGGEFERFIKIGKYASEKNIRLWLRTVVVPDINDTEADMDKYAEFSKQFKFEKYELLAFHTMGFFKYDELKIKNLLKETKALDKSRLHELQEYLDGKIEITE